MRWTAEITVEGVGIDDSHLAEFSCERGGGDDYTWAPVSVASFKRTGDNPRLAVGSTVTASIIDTGASDYEWSVFQGKIMEARWDGYTGLTEYQCRGNEFLFYRRRDSTAANTNAGARGTLTTMLAASPWNDGGTDMTDRCIGNAQLAINRPAQGSDMMNGEYLKTCFLGTSQNLVHRTYDSAGTGGGDMAPGPDRVFDYDVAVNGPFDTGWWPLQSDNIDAQKVSFVDCGYDTGQFYRKFRVKSTSAGTSGTVTASGISSTDLSDSAVTLDGYFKTNGDCTTSGNILAERQGSDLRLHRIFSMEYRPDVYHDLGGTNSTILYKMQPGDWVQFSNKPSTTAYTVNITDGKYNIAAGGSAYDIGAWDVRRVKYTWTPDGGWVFDVGLQCRTFDYISTGTW